MSGGRLADLHKSFARHLRAEGSSERTVAIYGQSIRFFSTWLEEQGRTADLDEMTRAGDPGVARAARRP